MHKAHFYTYYTNNHHHGSTLGSQTGKLQHSRPDKYILEFLESYPSNFVIMRFKFQPVWNSQIGTLNKLSMWECLLGKHLPENISDKVQHEGVID